MQQKMTWYEIVLTIVSYSILLAVFTLLIFSGLIYVATNNL